MKRLNKVSIFVADRGTGKTTYTREVMAAQSKKCLVIDTLDHPAYTDIELVDIERLKYWKKGNKRIITNLNRIKEDAAFLSKHVRNAFIVFEDATKYLRENTPTDVFSIIYDSKQKNVDVFLIYHNFENILKELLANGDYLTIGKLSENIDLLKKLPEKVAVLALQKKVNGLCAKNKNDFERRTIRIS